MNDSAKRWGITKLSAVPFLGFAYFSANFGFILGVVAGILLSGFSIFCFRFWKLPSSRKFVVAFLSGVAASCSLVVFLPPLIPDNPTFLGVVIGVLYLGIWYVVEVFAGLKSPNPDEELRELLDDPKNVTAKDRVESAIRKRI